MYDFHAHVLPTIDHGSRSQSDAEAQLAILAQSGITHVVATPHFYPDEWNNVQSFLDFRSAGEEMILPLLEKTPLQVFSASEVLVSEGIDRLANIHELCPKGTDVLLLEMPFFKWNDGLYKTVSRLCRSGLCILLAHIERYPLEDVRKLFEMGAFGQVNCEVFSHPLHRRAYRSLVRQGFVRALGSDIHLPKDFRAKNIERARAYLGEALMAELSAFGESKLAFAQKIAP